MEPKRSVIQPESGITAASDSRYPVETHWIVLRGACRSLERVSSATLTIVVSRTAMISPRTATPATTSVGRSSPPDRRSMSLSMGEAMD